MTRPLGFAPVCALAALAALAAYASADPPAARTAALPDPGDKPKYFCWEPHIAADPDHPDRVVLSAMYR
ncbi:MAG TPA: hypothetical protein VM597_31155, partial [Gemmataceae bacterium]|nr:hypothetical protein [Gemmataceae bacterium]